MIKNLQLISKHSQIKELGNSLKYGMLKELIRGSATCQQLSTLFSVSKQKIHYNLTKLCEEGLIEVDDSMADNGKEVYYHASAKNYVLDFALGEHLGEDLINGRGVIKNILEGEYHLKLSDIAAKILKDALKLKPREQLMVVTGKYNLPLVEKIIIEAGRMKVHCTVIYQDMDILRAKYEEYSLAAFNADYEHFNKLLKTQNLYLNLNGESRYLELKDPEKQRLRLRHFDKSRKIIQDKNIRVAVMPGLLNDTLSNMAIESELQFWKALDIDYSELCSKTVNLCHDFAQHQNLVLSNNGSALHFEIQRIWAECGSFGSSDYHSPVINFPGGEILIVPKANSLNGTISADVAYIFGNKVSNPKIKLKDNEIVSFSADDNLDLIEQAIDAGGADGRKVALVCMGTNDNIRLENIDLSYKHKTDGLVTVYWVENRTLGGEVCGTCEWFIQIDTPKLTFV
jgi:leucyl aminopeptidase (aminopeptidase T)